jgi:hypothetical protein
MTIMVKFDSEVAAREPSLNQDFPLGIHDLLDSKPPRVLLQLEGMTTPWPSSW